LFKLIISKVANIAFLNKYADDMGEIKIFRASAGSGKTHRLTQEYLNLLNKDERAYRRILAVTFTNKATEEMKRRVIEYLFNESLKGDVMSSKLLKNILHDYSAFNISTIDRFFQQTLRAFAREIGKNTSYGVELNQDMVLSQAIDKLLFNLDTENNETLLRWIMELSVQRIDSGKSWDVKSSINGTAGQLFKEAYKIAIKGEGEEFLDKNHIAEYSLELKRIIDDYQTNMRNFGVRGANILKEANLSPDDFSGKSKSFASRFQKILNGDLSLSNSTFIKASNGTEFWFSKSVEKDSPGLLNRGKKAEELHLLKLLNNIIEFENTYFKDYSTAQAISNNLYALGLMSDIQRSIREVTTENGVLLISETTELLHNIIDGSDTPFIFEKVGTKTDHFMLDEFQDTSLMQWENFRPLIINSLSSGYSNLIVGDEKQSIYRWRGSDWTLLNNTVFNDFRGDEINYTPLTENWRSGKEIIDFINDFFPKASKECDVFLELEEFSKINVSSIYSSVKQLLPKSRALKKGYVEIKISTCDKGDVKDDILSYVKDSILSILNNGGALRDIAVLVRRNTEGSDIAEYLIDSGIKVISGDSLFLTSATSVSSIISQLKYFSNPLDEVNNILAKFSGLDLTQKGELTFLPLYEMCEHLADAQPEEIKIAESAYIISFLDQVKEYIRLNRSDLSAFLEWWNENSSKLTIPAPEGEDAVRVLTIHKSKGLGFSTVIVPYSDFEFKGKSDIIWCKPRTSPFNRMPVVPINKADGLENSHFKEDLRNENFLRVVDNMNLAYVAFTRAKDNLFIYVKEPSKSSKDLKGAGDILYNFSIDKVNSSGYVKYGDRMIITNSKGSSLSERDMPLFKSFDNSENLRLTLRSEEFFNEDAKSRSRGVVIHSIMSNIISVEDISSAVMKAVSIGELQSDEIDQTISYFNELINSVSSYGWFGLEINTINELEIILPGGKIYRPDRVIKGDVISVIDFKTGKLRTKSHHSQLERYVTAITEMGYNNVKGYIWYLDDKEVVEVI
jgi:ATP-dependent exoDNAse (exonuclease V) beta subunit